MEDYSFRVNADLVGKFVNIGSRCAGFLEKNFAGRLGGSVENSELLEKFQHSFGVISEGYEKREYRKVIRVVMGLADDANRYIDDKKPWKIAKDKSKSGELHDGRENFLEVDTKHLCIAVRHQATFISLD